MKIETKRFIIKIAEDKKTSFRKNTIIIALAQIQAIRNEYSDTPKNERLPEDAQNEINDARNTMRVPLSTTYRGTVYLKQYQKSYHFSMNFNPEQNKWHKLLQETMNQVLSDHRKSLKVVEHSWNVGDREFEIIGFPWNKGHIFSKPGQIYKQYLKKKTANLYKTKIPEKPNKYIGVELEFCAPIAELDFAVKLWKSGVDTFTQIKEDRSLRPKPGETGYELALLFPERHYKRHLRKICKILAEVGAKGEDRRCGLHVHLDMRRRKKEIVYNNLIACQGILTKFLDPKRTNNEFCRLVKSRAFPTQFDGSREERYKTINAASYYKYKTLEVRMHEGSVNFTDISNWIDLLVKIANHKVRIKPDIKELTVLKKRFKLDNKMRGFFQDKTCYWQLQTPPERTTTNPFHVGHVGIDDTEPPVRNPVAPTRRE